VPSSRGQYPYSGEYIYVVLNIVSSAEAMYKDIHHRTTTHKARQDQQAQAPRSNAPLVLLMRQSSTIQDITMNGNISKILVVDVWFLASKSVEAAVIVLRKCCRGATVVFTLRLEVARQNPCCLTALARAMTGYCTADFDRQNPTHFKTIDNIIAIDELRVPSASCLSIGKA
jgi:hypothetical protein